MFISQGKTVTAALDAPIASLPAPFINFLASTAKIASEGLSGTLDQATY